jgi:hypothetical protein
MRYMLLQYLSGGDGMLYQIHDDAGAFLRFADMDGNTLDSGANPFSATLITADVAPPAWHVEPDPAPDPEPDLGPVPEFITKRQFLIQLVRSGMVAAEEVSSLPYQPPALMDAVLANMPEEAALEARLSWAAMTQVERNSSLVLAAAAGNNISEADLDAFFRAAAAI